MKKTRHEKILEIVNENIVTTQDELIEKLNNAGFAVTQATVSRDIKELRLIKTSDKNGIQRYTVIGSNEVVTPKYDYIFSSSVVSVTSAMNDVVIKCYAGMANAACAVIDSMNYDEVVGSLAGDDTIFIIAKTENDAVILVEKLKSLK